MPVPVPGQHCGCAHEQHMHMHMQSGGGTACWGEPVPAPVPRQRCGCAHEQHMHTLCGPHEHQRRVTDVTHVGGSFPPSLSSMLPPSLQDPSPHLSIG